MTSSELKGLEFQFRRGQLVLVLGATGSGKSTLLAGLAGEALVHSGTFAVRDGCLVSFAPQEAWVRNATIRSNILFELPFDAYLYQEVIRVSQLATDLARFEDGDKTEIGERGVTLSGGQKARVSFARALYRTVFLNLSPLAEPSEVEAQDVDTDGLLVSPRSKVAVLALDDPLAAVDAEVAKRMFELAITGPLLKRANVAVVLALNANYHLIDQADQVLLLSEGRQEICASPQVAIEQPFLQAFVNQRENEMQRERDSTVVVPTAVPTALQYHAEELGAVPATDGEEDNSDSFPVRKLQSTVSMRVGRLASEFFDRLDSGPVYRQGSSSLLVGDAPNPLDTLTEDASDSAAQGQSPRTLVKAESRQKGAVQFKVLAAYVSAGSTRQEGFVKSNYTGSAEAVIGSFSLGKGFVAFGAMFLFAAVTTFIRWYIDICVSFWAAEREVFFSPLSANPPSSGPGHWFGPFGWFEGWFVSDSKLNSAVEFPLTGTKVFLEPSPLDHHWITVTWLIGVIGIIVAMLKECWTATVATRASSNLHEIAWLKLLKAPVATFFDVQPLGRFLNRLTRDQDTIDTLLPTQISDLLWSSCNIVLVLISCAIATPWFLLAILPVLVIYNHTMQYFRKSLRELKRLEALSRSPVFTLFGEAVEGASALRSLDVGRAYSCEKLNNALNHNNRGFLLLSLLTRWLALRLDVVTALLTLGVALLTAGLSRVTNSSGDYIISPAMAGVALTNITQLSNMMQWNVRYFVDMEANLSCVERIQELLDTSVVPQEQQIAPREPAREQDIESGVHTIQTTQTADCSPSWPERGEIEVSSAGLRYRPDLPLSMKNMTLSIKAGTRVALVGRSGAGKSTLLQALLRMSELADGSILIDGRDISATPLDLLRRKVAVIPQDPVLFSGTLRQNLDPFESYADARLLAALRQCQLTPALKTMVIRRGEDNASSSTSGSVPVTEAASIESLDESQVLSLSVAEGGDNFSAGQRQLICVARALLKGSRVLILDEATACVDAQTDALLQTVLDSLATPSPDENTLTVRPTIIAVAHRLQTIIGYDEVCVIDNGSLVEQGTPMALLQDENSRFAQLAEQMGAGGRRGLLGLAKQAQKRKMA